MEVSEAKRLKSLEDERRKLKKLLAKQVMDNATLKEMLSKNFSRIPRGKPPRDGRSQTKTIRNAALVVYEPREG